MACGCTQAEWRGGEGRGGEGGSTPTVWLLLTEVVRMQRMRKTRPTRPMTMRLSRTLPRPMRDGTWKGRVGWNSKDTMAYYRPVAAAAEGAQHRGLVGLSAVLGPVVEDT